MKHALFILEDPKALDSKDLALWNFANNVQEQGAQNLGVEIVNAGSYICSLEHGLNGLNLLLSIAQDRGFHSRTLFFDQDPAWVTS